MVPIFGGINKKKGGGLHSLFIFVETIELEKTLTQYEAVFQTCKEVFLKKTKDYGTAWRILRPMSLTDQLFIKAKRIRAIEEKGSQKVNDPVEAEYVGLINYSIMALIQLHLPESNGLDLPLETVEPMYDDFFNRTKLLMMDKNHDYGEVWREMRVSSITDLILMKLLRIKQIEDNQGKTLISEGIDANYMDIINYAVFALIKLNESRS